MYLIACDQFGIRIQAGFNHLLFCVAMKRGALLQLCVLPDVGDDGRHCEREAGGKRLLNDDHFQVCADFMCKFDR